VASKAKSEAETPFQVADCFKGQYRALLAQFPEIADTIETFNRNKRTRPPTPLPAHMRDHKLDGRLKGVRECHLAGDVLLLYEHKDDVVKLLYICHHEDLYGKRGKQLATRIGDLLKELAAKYPPK